MRTLAHADLQSSVWGEQTDTLKLLCVCYFASSSYARTAYSSLGEAVQTLNNVSLLEQLGVKTQCEISEKKNVFMLFLFSSPSLPLASKGRRNDTLLLLPPADIHCCIPFHIIHPHFSEVVTDFLNERIVNEWGTVRDACRFQASRLMCTRESNFHADTQLVVMFPFFFPFNEYGMSWCESVCVHGEARFKMWTKYRHQIDNTGCNDSFLKAQLQM